MGYAQQEELICDKENQLRRHICNFDNCSDLLFPILFSFLCSKQIWKFSEPSQKLEKQNTSCCNASVPCMYDDPQHNQASLFIYRRCVKNKNNQQIVSCALRIRHISCSHNPNIIATCVALTICLVLYSLCNVSPPPSNISVRYSKRYYISFRIE